MTKKHGIIVGAYPSENSKAFGGVIYNCEVLKSSPLYDSFLIHEVDTTQISIPPPNVLIRFFLSLTRILKLISLLLKLNLLSEKPKFMLLFAGRGFSYIEKSLYSLIFRPFVHTTFLYPLGPRLIDDSKKSYIQSLSTRFVSRFPSYILCQGRLWFEFFNQFCGIPSKSLFILPSWTSTLELQ